MKIEGINKEQYTLADHLAQESVIRILRNENSELLYALIEVRDYLEAMEEYLPENQMRDEIANLINETIEKAEGKQ